MTADYVSNLVDAAVDAHDILTDGAGGVCPPPAYQPGSHLHGRSVASIKAIQEKGGGASIKKRLREDLGEDDDNPRPGSIEDTWDTVSVPLPKVKKVKTSTTPPPDVSMTSNASVASDAAASASSWTGLAGVDLFGPRRRAPYASIPNAIETKSFIFPICHDAELYGRILEVQKARRKMMPILQDSILMGLVESEGQQIVRGIENGRRLGEGEAMTLAGAAGASQASAASSAGGAAGTAAGAAGSGAASADDAAGGGAAEGEAGPEDEVGGIMALRNGPADGAVWPGLETLLPTYKMSVEEEDDEAKKKEAPAP